MSTRIVLVVLVATMLYAWGMKYGACQEDAADANIATIIRKMETLLTNQTEILKQLGDIKQELDVIRVRATRR